MNVNFLKKKTTLTLLSDPALVELEGQGWKGVWGRAWGSSLGNYSMLSTAGKNKQTQNLMSCVAKEGRGWFHGKLKLLLPGFLMPCHLPLLRAPVSHCVQLSFQHSWQHDD